MFVSRYNKLLPFISRSSCMPLVFPFSRLVKKTSLILHSSSEIQKMHINNKRLKQKKQWSTIHEKAQTKYTVSLIGLPNSGKSTLFNCIIGEQLAIVDKLAGFTRDRKQFTIMDGLVKVVDTPGVQVTAFSSHSQRQPSSVIKKDIFKQTVLSFYESDMIILVIDAKKPVSQDLIELVKYIRIFGQQKQNKKTELILVCNKCDGSYDEGEAMNEAYKLGINQIMYCSGEEGTGIFELIERIDKSISHESKVEFQILKAQRVKKFQALVEKLKQEMKQLEVVGKSIKQWEYDFRKINPDPELNQDLDDQNFQDHLIKPNEAFSSNRGTQIKNLKMKNSIKICFVGRPNVGKSSIINQLLGEERLVVSDIPHTTRDSIITKIIYKNRKMELVDTAGLNTANFDRNDQLYLKKVQISTMLNVKQSHVVIYTMDAFSAFKITDFDIIQQIIKEGRPIIIAVNKWQSIKEQYKYKAINYLKKQISQNLGHQLHGYPLVFISAKMRHNLDGLLDYIIMIYDKWNSRISTGLLNNWLDKFKKLDNLPKQKELTLKINYLIQARVRPPHFIFFVNNKGVFKSNYLRFVTDNVAKQFGMDGIPLRISLRSTNNKQKKIRKSSPKKISPIKIKMQELKEKYHNFGLKQ